MRNFNFTVLALNIIVLLFSLACLAVGMVSYVAAQNPINPIISTTMSALLPTTTTSLVPTPTPAVSPAENKGDYYRGMYDLCLVFEKDSAAPKEQMFEKCRDLVRLAIDHQWFETPSQGWEWPLPIKLPSNLDQLTN